MFIDPGIKHIKTIARRDVTKIAPDREATHAQHLSRCQRIRQKGSARAMAANSAPKMILWRLAAFPPWAPAHPCAPDHQNWLQRHRRVVLIFGFVLNGPFLQIGLELRRRASPSIA